MEMPEVFKAFLNRSYIPGVFFEHNDFVQVISGKYVGEKGSLVNVCKLQPEPKYILELESGYDIEVLQSEIKKT
jgi:hypothetical protein